MPDVGKRFVLMPERMPVCVALESLLGAFPAPTPPRGNAFWETPGGNPTPERFCRFFSRRQVFLSHS
jgi:hypothetical protein